MKLRRTDSAGVTLVESMIAMALVTLLSGGLYSCGIMVKKLTVFNSLWLQSCGFGVEKLEELVASGLDDIKVNTPFPRQILVVRGDREITRSVEVVGYDAFGAATNIASSLYLELHVYTTFVSPVNERVITNTLSTLVR